MRHLELFAGIGGFRRAMDLLTKDHIMNFSCVGYSENDKNATATYCANFNPGKDEVTMGDIVMFTENPQNIQSLPEFDLLTGGFPCQTFSMMGKKAGFNEDRGQMFFRIMDILEVKHPRYVLLENVKNLINHDKGNTFARIKQELENLGYHVFPNIYNTANFHLPQTRNRLVVFATKDDIDEKWMKELFTPANVKETFDKVFKRLSPNHYPTVIDVLSKEVDGKYFLSERIKPTILADGSANFKSKSDINMSIARPLTATMHKMHRACQDNYYSLDFIESYGEINHVEDYTKEQLAQLPIRRLTPDEAFMLQGFPKEFAIKAREVGVSDGALYKQAGNAVSVNTIYAILYFLITNNLMIE
jgi:DNA (cytosine-5)-methyltransferase 1